MRCSPRGDPTTISNRRCVWSGVLGRISLLRDPLRRNRWMAEGRDVVHRRDDAGYHPDSGSVTSMDSNDRLRLSKMTHPVRGFLHGGAAASPSSEQSCSSPLPRGGPTRRLSLLHSGLSLVAMLSTSLLYHSISWQAEWEEADAKLDHSMIPVLVAGTMPDRRNRSRRLVAVVDAQCANGDRRLRRVAFVRTKVARHWVSVALATTQGWLAIFIFWPLAERLPWDRAPFDRPRGPSSPLGNGLSGDQASRLCRGCSHTTRPSACSWWQQRQSTLAQSPDTSRATACRTRPQPDQVGDIPRRRSNTSALRKTAMGDPSPSACCSSWRAPSDR